MWHSVSLLRAYRIGQCRDVTVLRLISLGTVEEIIYLRQVYKQVHMSSQCTVTQHNNSVCGRLLLWLHVSARFCTSHDGTNPELILLDRSCLILTKENLFASDLTCGVFSVTFSLSSSNCSAQLWVRRVRGGTSRQCKGTATVGGSCLGSKTSSGCRPKGHALPTRYLRSDSLHHAFHCHVDS